MNVKLCATAIALAAAFSVAAPAADHSGHKIVQPGELKWVDVPSLPPGAKAALIEGDPSKEGFVTFRVKLPPNYRIAPHYHGTVERSTIVSGTLNIGMGEKFDAQKATAMPPGTVLIMPPKMPHFAFTTKDEVIFQLNVQGPWTVTFVNPADDPRKK